MPVNKPASAEEALAKLKPQQRRFVEAYCICFNQTEAARSAGYSPESARTQGSRMLRNVNIRTAIDLLCEELSMSAGEAFKHITDVAKTRLQDYMVIREVERTARIRKSLQEVINDLAAEIELEEEYAKNAELDDDDQNRHKKQQKARRNKVVRLRLELSRNPNAYRIVDSEPELVEQASVDLVALAKAQGQGRIKSLSFTEFGPKVELESSFAALETVLKLHGRFVQKIEAKVEETGADLRAWTAEDFKKFEAWLNQQGGQKSGS